METHFSMASAFGGGLFGGPPSTGWIPVHAAASDRWTWFREPLDAISLQCFLLALYWLAQSKTSRDG